MLASILGWLSGGLVKELVGPLERAYKAKLEAQNDKDRIEAEQQVAFYEGQIALATAVAQHGKWWSVQNLMGYCAFVYVAKLVVIDTVLKLGTTPDPGPQVSGIVLTIIGFFFGSRAVSDIAAKTLGAFIARKR